MRAASKGLVDIVTVLLENGADTSVRDYKGATALTLATQQGHAQIRSLLIKHGARE